MFFQMLPWLMLYSAFVIFLTSLLIYFLIILENVWIKIILFLVVSPCLVITVACCLAVFCMYRVIKLSVKTGYVDIYLLEFSKFIYFRWMTPGLRPQSQLVTLYAPEPGPAPWLWPRPLSPPWPAAPPPSRMMPG